MSSAEQLQHLLAKYDLQRVGGEIERSIRSAIHIRKQKQRETVARKQRFFGLLPGKRKEIQTAMPVVADGSHFGGRPQVGPDFRWPNWKGKPLGFLAQIYCEEITAHDAEHLWPNAGSLCFFYAIKECPWGGEVDDAGSWAVIHCKHQESCPAELPSGLDEDELLPAYPVSFGVFSSLPDSPGGVELTDAEFEGFCELRAEFQRGDLKGEPAHQTLGHADAIQGPVEDEWEEFQAKMKRPDDGSDWKLLLQFDSDDDLDVMWGDAGMLYFGIRESAFRAQRFEQAQMIMQCC